MFDVAHADHVPAFGDFVDPALVAQHWGVEDRDECVEDDRTSIDWVWSLLWHGECSGTEAERQPESAPERLHFVAQLG